MFNLFKSKAEKELDFIINEMKLNMENNYKSTAQEMREKLGRRCEELHSEGKLNEEKYKKYLAVYHRYTEILQGYHH